MAYLDSIHLRSAPFSCKEIRMKKRITVASAVVAAAAALTSALLARRARFFAQAPPQRNEATPVPLLDERHSHAAAAWGLYDADAASGRNAARGLLRVGPGADPARQRLLPHRRLSGIGGLRDLEY